MGYLPGRFGRDHVVLMTARSRRRKSARKAAPRRNPAPDRRGASKVSHARPTTKFVGRDASPVLERYPKKDPALIVRGPPTQPTPAPAAPPAPAAAPGAAASPTPDASRSPGASPLPGPPAKGLIALEKPFDLDEFSQLLGETTFQVVVPKEDLPEVLRRISDFMGFGIYVYSFRVRPAPEELLKSFIVELQRVDYSAVASDWAPFQEQGRSDSPFGPLGRR
jgi:hypothetical protein